MIVQIMQGGYTLALFDARGSQVMLVQLGAGQTQQVLELSNRLGVGVYQVQLRTEHGFVTRSLVVWEN